MQFKVHLLQQSKGVGISFKKGVGRQVLYVGIQVWKLFVEGFWVFEKPFGG